MRVKKIATSGRERSANPIFKGDVDYQTLVGEDVSHDLSMSEVHFRNGARNKWHLHSTDQMLVITEGEGIVADEKEERVVSVGDVAFIPKATSFGSRALSSAATASRAPAMAASTSRLWR